MYELGRDERSERHGLTEGFSCGSISDEQFRTHFFSYEECSESNRTHHDTLVTDSPYHALVHELLACPARTLLHDVSGSRVQAQRQGREGLAYQVYPQDVDRKERNAHIKNRCHEQEKHFSEIGGQQEEYGLQDVVINPPAF